MERACGRLKLVFAGWMDASRVCGKLTAFIFGRVGVVVESLGVCNVVCNGF